MSLVTFVENVETLEESIRSFYKEVDGGYVLDAEPANGYAVENITGLTSALNKERKAAKEYEKQLKSVQSKWDGLDDPEEIRSQLTKLEELIQLDPIKEADKIAEQKIEAAKKRIEAAKDKAFEAKWQAEVEPLKKDYESIYKQLHKEIVSSNALKAIAMEEGDTDLLMPHIVSKVRVLKEEDGSFTPAVYGDNDEPLYNSSGKLMSIQELVASYKTKFPNAFKSSVKAGGGVSATNRSTQSSTSNKLSSIEMIQQGLKTHGMVR